MPYSLKPVEVEGPRLFPPNGKRQKQQGFQIVKHDGTPVCFFAYKVNAEFVARYLNDIEKGIVIPTPIK